MSEIKYNFISATINQDVNTFYVANITVDFPQGVDKDNRIGNKIKYRNLTVKFGILMDETAGGAAVPYLSRVMRVLIVQPRTDLSTPVAMSDIFDLPNNYLSTVKGTAVRVLYDRMANIVPMTASNQLAVNSGRFVRKLVFRNRNNVTFRDSTVNLPTDDKDLYYLIVITDAINSGAGNYTLQGNWFVRQSYIDV